MWPWATTACTSWGVSGTVDLDPAGGDATAIFQSKAERWILGRVGADGAFLWGGSGAELATTAWRVSRCLWDAFSSQEQVSSPLTKNRSDAHDRCVLRRWRRDMD